jgi:hyperosmotically inducible protein
MKIKVMKYAMICLWAGTLAVTTIATSGCSHSQYRRSSGEYMDDKTLTARVKTALIRAPNVSAAQVHVDAYQGVVALNGFVDTPEQKSRAEEVTRQVSGVREVKNNLVVRADINNPNSSGTTTR